MQRSIKNARYARNAKNKKNPTGLFFKRPNLEFG